MDGTASRASHIEAQGRRPKRSTIGSRGPEALGSLRAVPSVGGLGLEARHLPGHPGYPGPRMRPMPPELPPHCPRVAIEASGSAAQQKGRNPHLLGIPAFLELRWSLNWWRWGESNPRPKARDLRYYMLSSLLILVRRQHNVRGTPSSIPAKFTAGWRVAAGSCSVIMTLHPRARAQVGSGLTP